MSFIDYSLKPSPETEYVPNSPSNAPDPTIKVPLQRCYAYKRGNCNRGEHCRYAHIDTRQSNAAQSGRNASTADDATAPTGEQDVPSDSMNIPGGHVRCVDFTKGRCRRGNQCRFPHQELCLDFTRGDCHRPDCRFFHPRTKKDKSKYVIRHDERNMLTALPDGGPDGAMLQRSTGDAPYDPEPPVFPRNNTCVDFVEGCCARGKTCKFVHPPACYDYNNGGCFLDVCSLLHVDPVQGIDRIDPNLCFDYQVGKCDRGSKCRYVHDGPEIQDLGGCFDFSVGKCKRGDACKFRHDIPPSGVPRHLRSAPY